MKIAILLMGRYPTEKAYGVTTNGTIRSLVNLGHEVTVYGTHSEYLDLPPVNSNLRICNYKETILSEQCKRIALRKFGFSNKVFWRLHWILLKRQNRKLIFLESFDLFWIRNQQMLSWLSGAKRIVLEVHQKIHKRKILRKLKEIKNVHVVIAPISRKLNQDLSFLAQTHRLVYAPMGIEASQIQSEQNIRDFSRNLYWNTKSKDRELNVGYVGKFFPNGYSKGIEDLINLAKYAKQTGISIKVVIAGGIQSEIETVLKTIDYSLMVGKEIEILPHMSHIDALSLMSSLDVIVLPKPNSANYLGFPLKSIEAVASGRIVVAAKCGTYEDIFGSDFKPYWYEPGDEFSLLRTIEMAVADPNLEFRIMEGIAFAAKFDWKRRTTRILEAVDIGMSTIE